MSVQSALMTQLPFEAPTPDELATVVARHEITSLKSPSYTAAVDDLISDEEGDGYRQRIMKALYVYVRDEVTADSSEEEVAAPQKVMA